jgi:hypothetical protein
VIRQIPIVFGADSVQAILAGVKTQTRRLADVRARAGVPRVELYPRLVNGTWGEPFTNPIDASDPRSRWAVFSPVGDRVSDPIDVWSKLAIGDELWVREAWKNVVPSAGCEHKAIPTGPEHRWDTDGEGYAGARYRATWTKSHSLGWSSPRFMPKWASRLTLVCTGRKLERLQQITAEDAVAEGITPEMLRKLTEQHAKRQGVAVSEVILTPEKAYVQAFQSLNEHRTKDRPVVEQLNPYVWRIDFRLKGSS